MIYEYMDFKIVNFLNPGLRLLINIKIIIPLYTFMVNPGIEIAQERLIHI